MTPSSYQRSDGTTVTAHPFGIGGLAQGALADWCDTRDQKLRLIDGALCFYSKPLPSGENYGWKFGMLKKAGRSEYSTESVGIGDYVVELPGGELVAMTPDRFIAYMGWSI